MDDRPRNLREMLAEAKDSSELMIDLAYAALYFGDPDMAEEVGGLEETLSELIQDMRGICILAVRNPREAEGMSSVLQVISAIERMANDAGNRENRDAQREDHHDVRARLTTRECAGTHEAEMHLCRQPARQHTTERTGGTEETGEQDQENGEFDEVLKPLLDRDTGDEIKDAGDGENRK